MKELNAEGILKLKNLTIPKPGFSSQRSLGEFFDLYLICEVSAKVLVAYYSPKNKKRVLRIDNIKSAIRVFFPNDIERIPVNEIFQSGNGTRNNKSCRQLRNSYFHELSEKDRIEIEERIIVLKSYMEIWINLFS